MSGFFGIGGNDNRVIKKGLSTSENIYNKALGLVDPLAEDYKATTGMGKDILNTGLRTTKGGLDTIGSAKDYFQRIMSGSRPDMMAAIAPEINAVNETADASRTSGATFGTQRGGGVNAANQAAETARMTDITNAIFGARPSAAKEVGALGAAESKIGLDTGALGINEQEVGVRQLEAGLRALGLSEEAIANMTRNAVSSKQATTQAWKGLFDMLLGGGQIATGFVPKAAVPKGTNYGIGAGG